MDDRGGAAPADVGRVDDGGGGAHRVEQGHLGETGPGGGQPVEVRLDQFGERHLQHVLDRDAAVDAVQPVLDRGGAGDRLAGRLGGTGVGVVGRRPDPGPGGDV